MQSTITPNFAAIAARQRALGIATNADLSRRMGMSEASISRVMAGAQNPGPTFIASLSKALGAPVEHLFVIERVA